MWIVFNFTFQYCIFFYVHDANNFRYSFLIRTCSCNYICHIWPIAVFLRLGVYIDAATLYYLLLLLRFEAVQCPSSTVITPAFKHAVHAHLSSPTQPVEVTFTVFQLVTVIYSCSYYKYNTFNIVPWIINIEMIHVAIVKISTNKKHELLSTL